jgi:hypothetical protein
MIRAKDPVERERAGVKIARPFAFTLRSAQLQSAAPLR